MTDLNDTITTSSGCDTITLNNDGSSIWGVPAFDTITLNSYLGNSAYLTSGYANAMNGTAPTISGTPTYTISNGISSNSTYTYNGAGPWGYASNGKPFIDAFPEWNAFKKLCDDYPGLSKSYENLKTIYTICYEDSILPKDNK